MKGKQGCVVVELSIPTGNPHVIPSKYLKVFTILKSQVTKPANSSKIAAKNQRKMIASFAAAILLKRIHHVEKI